MQSSLVIALVVVLIIAVAAYFWLNRKCTTANCVAPKTCNAAGKCVAPPACSTANCTSPNICNKAGQCVGPTYTQQVGNLWDPSTDASIYKCPIASTISEACAVGDLTSAQNICSADSTCIGFLVPTSTAPIGRPVSWINYSKGAIAQLVNIQPVLNNGYPGTTYYQKVMPSS